MLFHKYILIIAILSICIACNSEEDLRNPDNQEIEVVDVSAEDLFGHWYCISQKWDEAGSIRQASYDIIKDEYYINFEDDFTGQLRSGEDLLMEISQQDFDWSVSNGIISLGKSKTEKWYIKEFSENSLTLYWFDKGYNITCKFIRDSGGNYKPVLGHQIMHIDNYYLRETKKEMKNSHDFSYDSQGRIKEWKNTSYYGSGSVKTTVFNYIDNYIIVDESIKYPIGENGYFKISNTGYIPSIKSQDIIRLTYNNEGYISNIDYGEELLEKGEISYIYDDRGYSSILESFYEKEKNTYIYNVEFPNNASINLIPLYTYGGYLNNILSLFDISGKRPPYLVREYSLESRRDYTHKKFILMKDKEGRITKIKESTDLTPEVWDIYYEKKDESPDLPTENEGTIADPIDLGLSVKWASWNIGATKPNEYGCLYAWGIPDAQPGYIEGKRPFILKEISGTEYDIARNKWGNSWRLPTASEQAELVTECKWELVKEDDITGLKVTGPSGNSIFLPAAGYQNSVATIDCGDIGYYWSGTIMDMESKRSYPAYRFFTTSETQLNWIWSPANQLGSYDLNYCVGMSIRPVCN